MKALQHTRSTCEAEGGAGPGVNNAMNTVSDTLRELLGVMHDEKMCINIKYNMYKTIVKPAMIYLSENWRVKKTMPKKLHAIEMKMLIWIKRQYQDGPH